MALIRLRIKSNKDEGKYFSLIGEDIGKKIEEPPLLYKLHYYSTQNSYKAAFGHTM